VSGSDGEHKLQATCDTTARADRFYRDQVLDHLNPAMIEFVGRMEMAFIATADAKGECDASLRAGPPGFLLVLDPWTLAYPEYRGNGVMASLGNITENPHVGILMVDFTRDRIGLHINGRAAVVSTETLARLADHSPRLLPMNPPGKRAERWVMVAVQEAYVHCRKHIPLMRPVPVDRDWGTDDTKRKGGDYFGVRADRMAEPATPEIGWRRRLMASLRGRGG
jgi:uncharacterized protein